MISPRMARAWCATFAFLVLVSHRGDALAAAYDSVRDLGPDAQMTLDGHGQKVVVSRITGETIPFPNRNQASTLGGSGGSIVHLADRPWTLDPAQTRDPRGLPTVVNAYGSSGSMVATRFMSVSSANTAGTVIGAYEMDHSLGGFGTGPIVYQYTQKQADGTYGPLHVLNSAFDNGAQYFLNASNQILSTHVGPSYGGSPIEKLLDLDTGSSTDVADLFSPEDRARFLFQNPYDNPSIHPLGLSDNGSILVDVLKPDSTHTVLLLTPATPTPEPSTLALLVAAGASVAWRRSRRQARSRKLP